MLDPKYAGKSILSGAEIDKAYGVITTVSYHRGLDEAKFSTVPNFRLFEPNDEPSSKRLDSDSEDEASV